MVVESVVLSREPLPTFKSIVLHSFKITLMTTVNSGQILFETAVFSKENLVVSPSGFDSLEISLSENVRTEVQKSLEDYPDSSKNLYMNIELKSPVDVTQTLHFNGKETRRLLGISLSPAQQLLSHCRILLGEN